MGHRFVDLRTLQRRMNLKDARVQAEAQRVAAGRSPLVAVRCAECQHTWRVRATTPTGPYCPKCNSADVDVTEPQ